MEDHRVGWLQRNDGGRHNRLSNLEGHPALEQGFLLLHLLPPSHRYLDTHVVRPPSSVSDQPRT